MTDRVINHSGRAQIGATVEEVRREAVAERVGVQVAAAGAGATLTDADGSHRLAASGCAALGDSLVAVSLPPLVAADSPDLAGFVSVVQACRAVRRSGSAARNLAYVAAGRRDAHWAHIIKPWDAAAGVLIARNNNTGQCAYSDGNGGYVTQQCR